MFDKKKCKEVDNILVKINKKQEDPDEFLLETLRGGQNTAHRGFIYYRYFKEKISNSDVRELYSYKRKFFWVYINTEAPTREQFYYKCEKCIDVDIIKYIQSFPSKKRSNLKRKLITQLPTVQDMNQVAEILPTAEELVAAASRFVIPNNENDNE